jgi:hypothetical protein
MAELFASGRVVDGILLLMLIELIALTWWGRISGRGTSMIELGASLGAGAALLLALRCALLGEPWQRIAPWLIAALVAHLIDAACRCKVQRFPEVI